MKSKTDNSKVKSGQRSLKELQGFMWSAISRPLTANFEMRKRWVDGSSLDQIAKEYIRANSSLSSFERLEIYNQQYWYRVLDCFEDDFPGLKAVLGERRFSKLARDYLTEHPSNSFSLRNLGENLVSFIDKRKELVEPEVQLCLEVARFEWAQIEAFDGAAKPPIGEAYLSGKSPLEIFIALQPYITLLELNYALDDYSVALTRHHRDRSEAGSAKEKEKRRRPAPWPVPGKNYLAVHRHQNSVYFKRLELPAFLMLSSLSQGKSLNDAVVDVLPYLNESKISAENLQVDIQNWFKLWMKLGWLCSP